MNKPVAIVNTNCENNIQWYDDNPKQHNGYFLYTHPADLTDEEIEVLWEKHCPFDLTAGIDFARAILKRHKRNECKHYLLRKNTKTCMGMGRS